MFWIYNPSLYEIVRINASYLDYYKKILHYIIKNIIIIIYYFFYIEKNWSLYFTRNIIRVRLLYV